MKFRLLILLGFLLLMTVHESFAQKRKLLQMSGIVLGNDSTSGIPGVYIYVPKAGRGTSTNPHGFFSLPVLVGDSVIVSCVGYERQYYIVPDHPSEYLTLVFELSEDITYLPEIEVTPFPTEEVFKQAVLALNLPEEKSYNKDNLDKDVLALLLRSTPVDGYQNQRYFLDQWTQQQSSKYGPVQNPFLNPFNWAKFIQSLRKNKPK